MLRYLLVLLAVLVAVLAYLFDRPWLRVGAIVIFVGGVGLLAWRAWSAYSDGTEPREPQPASSDSEEPTLEDLGIVDIRPQEEQEDPPAAAEPTGDAVGGHESAGAPPSTGQSASEEHPATRTPTEPSASTADEPEEPAPSPSVSAAEPSGASDTVASDDAPVLGPLLLSLRAALDAETVCLLVQEDVALTYRIEALASRHRQVRTNGTFDTQTPLVTASMSRHDVGIRSLPETELAIEDLGYYTSPPGIDHLAVAPVPRPDQPSTTFLLADATKGTDLGASDARRVLEHYAETLDVLLPSQDANLRPDRQSQERAPKDQNRDASGGAAVNTDEEKDTSPRPRREIIEEEIEAAEADADNLALVLVHLNRAESIARRGEEAVASAERLFRARLEQLAPNQRVERFGELTYGVFFRGGADAVEPWVADLEAEMDREEGELEGGASVGVAVRGDHDAQTLRTDATEALREAYRTGTSTIVA